MPRNAIETGAIDFVLSPQEIARELVEVARHPCIAHPPIGEPAQQQTEAPPEQDKDMQRIFALLLHSSGVDFSNYKPNTIRRRIGRRMIVVRTSSLREYVSYLDANPTELRELYRDLLISVTSFFRDAEVFTSLRRLLTDTLAGRPADNPVRIWVPGCATGEEVYSLAIAVFELLEELQVNAGMQLFGTDISEMAVERARAGIYAENIAEDVSQERLARFFVKVDRGYQVNRMIRQCCVFARQDVTRDPPFANTDLIACRNVMIYMDTTLQRRVLPVFHYSLKPAGLLLLGTAESVAAATDLFEAVDPQHRIYRRRAVPVRITLDLAHGRRHAKGQNNAPPESSGRIGGGSDMTRRVDRIVLSKYAPPAVVVDESLRIVQFRGHTSFYLDPSPGDASLNLMRMARESLAAVLRRVIDSAREQGVAVREPGISVEYAGETRNITIEVTPVQGPAEAEKWYLVVFDDSRPTVAPAPPPPAVSGADGDPPPVDRDSYIVALELQNTQLQQQLTDTRAYLRNLTEDHETSTEELRAANEEVRSSNEELQSTNEELSITKEELQSANEELTTVNEELQSRNQELHSANNDLINLLGAVRIPIVMVDSGLRIRRFNTASERLLELTHLDFGQSLSRLKIPVDLPELDSMTRNVIETLSPQQYEVQDRSGTWYQLVIRPYRTSDNRIDGAVLVFVDIDPLKRSLLLAEEARDYAEAVLETVREPLVVLDSDLRVQHATTSFYSTFQVTPEETIGRLLYDLGNGQWNLPRLRELLGNALFQNLPFHDFPIEHEFPNIGRRTMRLNARRIPWQQEKRQRAVLLSIEDITVRIDEAEIRYQRLFESAKDGILVVDAATGFVVDVNPFFLQLSGFSRQDLVGKEFQSVPVFRDSALMADLVQQSCQQESIHFEAAQLLTRGGQTVDVEIVSTCYAIGSQRVVQINVRDITVRWRAERERAAAEDSLRQANRQLQRANADLEDFAYAVSHDIQEPLRTIALYTELFEQSSQDANNDAEARQYLTYIRQAVQRLQLLVTDLLSYTRAAASFQPPRGAVDPLAAVRTAIANLQGTIDDQKAAVTFGLLPPVRIHESHLVQLFQNIISNALKYRSEDPPRVRITATSSGIDVTLAIADNGVGIPPEYTRTIFGMFKRLHARSRPGTGMGLAICQKIVELYDGKIWVESVVNRGSTFFFSIPK
jgi:two-component system CheB/CheR fusion protein